MARKAPAPKRLTSTAAFRAYLRAVDDLAGSVDRGTVDREKALASQERLVGVLAAQLRRIFGERLAVADERQEEPARIETYPVPRLLDLASSSVVRTCAHRSPASEGGSPAGSSAVADDLERGQAAAEVPADPGPPAGGE